jgi:hypothetical protein
MPDGLLRFARYAFPPNERGLCGPDRAPELAEAIEAGVGDPDVRSIAEGFSGAWPYLVLLGSELSRGDPLDPAVVDAYWLGEPCGRRVQVSSLGDSLRERFGGRGGWEGLRDSVELGGWPTHAYHVFTVYPWVGLIRSGLVDPGLDVIDRCRIRWGRVVEISGDRAVVMSDQLLWNGHSIEAGPPRAETVSVLRNDGDIEAGGLVSLHWGWVCEPITPRQQRWLQASQEYHLQLANRSGATARIA